MTTRRTLLGLGGLGLFGGLVTACGGGGGGGSGMLPPFPVPMPAPSPSPAPAPAPASGWRMPDEGDAHRAVWMAFAARESI
ncbi:hypothetical protein [Variovorax boronicumulans]|uniref:hypothetical protein n=1 Tax=Variovorax boronicumulans TaxID=436515 RepID=UPI0021DA7F7E|nr:hypothetical protein [Variovorax boronicumulans]